MTYGLTAAAGAGKDHPNVKNNKFDKAVRYMGPTRQHAGRILRCVSIVPTRSTVNSEYAIGRVNRSSVHGNSMAHWTVGGQRGNLPPGRSGL